MNPPAGERDVGTNQPAEPIALHRPPRALSSPTSPNFTESEDSRSPLSKYEPKSYFSARPSQRRQDQSQERSRSPASISLAKNGDERQPSRNIIIRSYAPNIAVYAAPEIDELVSEKGIRGGLAALLRPFGEYVRGKVVIRDSHGLSKAWDDFGIHICDSEQLLEGHSTFGSNLQNSINVSRNEAQLAPESATEDIEALLATQLDRNSLFSKEALSGTSQNGSIHEVKSGSTSLFSRYLRVLLSSNTIVPYETFNHPVACLVAVSSRNGAPIETLRQLYAATGRNNPRVPAWLGTDNLRYYVLIHDEDRDDISKSTALFDLMKRHFGLHCHLLRLRSSQCVATDDDSVRVPDCDWFSASEKQAMIHGNDYIDDVEENGRFIFESDASAIHSLIREMVTQSIVPFMENRIAAWNDQVASRRRGIGGRFMSISKRWAGLGSSKMSNHAGGGTASPSNSNYDPVIGCYPPETPEAIMRSLADYAVMLRDWRLAHSTYELMRSDFSHDKAWNYHAAANEMAAITSLLTNAPLSKSRPENIDQWLDAAVYSYLTRCANPTKVRRCLLLATELLFDRGHPFAEHASGWAARILELSVLGSLEQCLVTERLAEYYVSKTRSGELQSRRRHTAMWNLLASLSWVQPERLRRAETQFQTARMAYQKLSVSSTKLPFESMLPLWDNLGRKVNILSSPHEQNTKFHAMNEYESRGPQTNVQGEQLDDFVANIGPALDGASHDFSKPPPTALEGISNPGFESDGFE